MIWSLQLISTILLRHWPPRTALRIAKVHSISVLPPLAKLMNLMLARRDTHGFDVCNAMASLASTTQHPGCLGLQILKDIINKYQLLQGRRVRYIPGWDCHGLPIELKAGLTFQSTLM